MTELTLKLNGEDVLVEFTYHKGFAGNRTEPYEPAEIEIERIYFEGVDVYSIISPGQLYDLERQLEQKRKELDNDS